MRNHSECADRLKVAALMVKDAAQFCYVQTQAAAKASRREDKAAYGTAYKATMRTLMELDDAMRLLNGIEKRKAAT